ncbi:aldolase-like protein [Thermacetogenium phaeum DSM 12270]|uniref:Aldolase-like protein n=1 Tax=Thermacetogenium phaeum (strain ATCC BAA-254 / DSM 26808 / PB) TaxID=1089553 RepID=K4LGK3_THEPS|nr:radical SAM protein [Thermacetogenium phaeum]AFV12146.1 aldolase-like protein [Thermacetogenium phaeum DSM 12270]
MPGLSNLMQQAWEIRKDHAPQIIFSAPGAKHYQNRFFANRRNSFVNLSVTGKACACRCAHCNGRLLETMIPTPTPEEMCRVVDRLMEKGCRGILVSGGADSRGEVPLLPFVDAIGYAKGKGLRVLVHSGLIRRETAVALREVGVDQVLLDVIGEESTIRDVYHLAHKPSDYLEAMLTCREAGLSIAPHVVIGLHYGRLLGEMKALEMISRADPQAVVLVIISPMKGTEMAGVEPPPVEETARVFATARLLNPDIPLTLGCARPPGRYKQKIEKLAVDCGVNAIAYPDEATITHARNKGLQVIFTEECCSLMGIVAGKRGGGKGASMIGKEVKA